MPRSQALHNPPPTSSKGNRVQTAPSGEELGSQPGSRVFLGGRELHPPPPLPPADEACSLPVLRIGTLEGWQDLAHFFLLLFGTCHPHLPSGQQRGLGSPSGSLCPLALAAPLLCRDLSKGPPVAVPTLAFRGSLERPFSGGSPDSSGP